MKKFILPLLLIASAPAFAQQSTSFLIAPAGLSAPADSSSDFFPNLQVIEADHSDEEGNQQIKDSLAAIYKNRPHVSSNARQVAPNTASVPAPVVGSTFAGNSFGSGTPNDNEVAIANNGHLLSVQNSSIFRYRTATNTIIGTQSLALWASPISVGGSKYDPKVIYDPQANRFILVCLAGYVSTQTKIIVGFSQSDSANGAYNLYALPGNPFNDTLWSDYPMIGLNGDELFLTVNLLHDNMSWQLGFVQSIIWQLNKWDGYNGDTLRTELHSGINYGGRPIRNLCPVEGGSNVAASPGMYFLSDRNLAASCDTVFLVHVSDTANSPNQQVTVTVLISNRSYWMPADATQSSGGNLATNDARILGAFIQNDKIQFVNNTMDTSSGNCAVYHGVISNVSTSPTLVATIIGDTSLEFGYPNLAYAGQGAGDNTAIIFFLHSDTTNFPGNSAVTTDGNGQYSPVTQVKAGLGYIDVLSGMERWGDYSGIQRRYDAGGTCWVNGMYGQSSHLHATWISEIGVTPDVGIAETATEKPVAEIFPNPFNETFQVIFTTHAAQTVRIVIYDASGREVSVLLNDHLNEGKFQFAFSTGPLAPGIYLLRAETADGSVLFTNRIVKD
jgi:hypothetical protein